MTYSTVSTKATGDTVAASDWNTYLRDNMADHEARIGAIAYSGCRVVRTTNQSIPDSTYTAISFTAETTDQGGWFPTTGTTATVPSGALPPGYTTLVLQVSVQLYWAGNATGQRVVRILKNGVEFFSWAQGPAGASNFGMGGTATDVTAVPSDTITVEVNQSSGGALNLIGATQEIALSIRRVGYY